MANQNQNIRKILIAPDKFKGSLTSSQAAEAIRRGLLGHKMEGICARGEGLDTCREGREGRVHLQFRMVEIADGGDGSLEVVEKKVANGRRVQCEAADPVGESRPVEYLMYERDGEWCAFIEMAKVSGLALLKKELRNPMHTSTYGLGEAVLGAVERGASVITLSIGGSATDDCGAGMLQALGYVFMDAQGEIIPFPICGGDLLKIGAIKAPQTRKWGKIEVICDVTNPLMGPDGATAVYAPQKGAGKEDMIKLEEGKRHFTDVAQRCLGTDPALVHKAGAGAAGGVGYAGLAFLNAELIPGWKFFAQITSLEESVRWADLVITGEGSLDSQSLSGKVVSGVITLAHKYGKPVMIFCGVNKLPQEEMNVLTEQSQGKVQVCSIASLGHPLEVCMRDAAKLLEQLAGENSSL